MELPLGTGTVTFDLPECDVTVLEPSGGEAVDEPLLLLNAGVREGRPSSANGRSR